MSDTKRHFPSRSQRDNISTANKGVEQVKNPETTVEKESSQPLDSFLSSLPDTQDQPMADTPRWAPVDKNVEVPTQIIREKLAVQPGLESSQPVITDNHVKNIIEEPEKQNEIVEELSANPQTPLPSTPVPVDSQARSGTAAVLVRLQNVSKHYGKGQTLVKALDDVSVDIYAGQFTAIVGASGSGKSTMLHCLAGLDGITAGNINVAGQQINLLGDNQLTKFRRQYIGFIFQAFNLVPTLTALENITLPQKLAKQKTDQSWLDKVVNALGLADRLSHKPSELSGGQQQRVAVARALVAKPALLVADEPTGNLDKSSSSEVLKMLRDAVNNLGQSVVMVTHDRRAAAVADRVLVVSDGKIVADMLHPSDEELAQVI